MTMRIAVGLSGGVDSSVAALLLKQQGHDVFGITMKIWDPTRKIPASNNNACFGPNEIEDVESAAETCGILGITHHLFDCSVDYRERILKNFKDEYSTGRTPNPCVFCNPVMKFGVLLDAARRSGLHFDAFATGHYARIIRSKDGKISLFKAVDLLKDQTYFLYRLTMQTLAQSIFPLGDLIKDRVRDLARAHSLPASEKKDSQNFYSGDYTELLDRVPVSGDIVNADGTVLGKHSGYWNFTIGQRKGLRVAYKHPLYVLKIDPVRNRVIVGESQNAVSSVCTVSNLNWLCHENPTDLKTVNVKIRSTAKEIPATLTPLDDGLWQVGFAEVQTFVTPGQSAVFYDGDRVLGGGVIVEAVAEKPDE